MINYKPTLRTNLLTLGYEVYYNDFAATVPTFPCVSYNEINNSAQIDSDSIRWSNVEFQIKIWCSTIEQGTPIGQALDTLMTNNGFTRTAYIEQNGEVKQLIFRYVGLAYEEV